MKVRHVHVFVMALLLALAVGVACGSAEDPTATPTTAAPMATPTSPPMAAPTATNTPLPPGVPTPTPTKVVAKPTATATIPPPPVTDVMPELIFVQTKEPFGMAPWEDTTTLLQDLYFAAYDSLVEVHGYKGEPTSVTNILATGWEVVDPLTWDYTIRDDVFFHDGTKMTAEDAAFSMTMDCFPDLAVSMKAPVMGSQLCDGTFEALDDTTMRVHFSSPMAAFVPATNFVLPKAAWESMGRDAFNNAPIGTGPWEFVEWRTKERIVLERNENYWRELAPSNKMIIKFIQDPLTRLAEMQSGRAHIMAGVIPDWVDLIDSSPEARIETIQSTRSVFFIWNTHNPILEDKRVRHALNYGVDTEEIVDTLFQGKFAQAMASPLQAGSIDYDLSLPVWGYDPAKAQQLLTDAGYPNGFELDYRTPDGRTPLDREVAEAVASYYEGIGITVNLGVHEWGEYWDGVKSGTWTMMLNSSNGSTPTGGCKNYFNLWHHTGSRGLLYSGTGPGGEPGALNDTWDAWIDSYIAEFDRATANDTCVQLQNSVYDFAPSLFSHQLVDTWAASNDIIWKPSVTERAYLYYTRAK